MDAGEENRPAVAFWNCSSGEGRVETVEACASRNPFASSPVLRIKKLSAFKLLDHHLLPSIYYTAAILSSQVLYMGILLVYSFLIFI